MFLSSIMTSSFFLRGQILLFSIIAGLCMCVCVVYVFLFCFEFWVLVLLTDLLILYFSSLVLFSPLIK